MKFQPATKSFDLIMTQIRMSDFTIQSKVENAIDFICLVGGKIWIDAKTMHILTGTMSDMERLKIRSILSRYKKELQETLKHIEKR